MKNQNTIKSAGGIVVRRNGKRFKVLLLYKNGEWLLPKGRIERESEKKAAFREIYEECGIPIKKMKIIGKLGKVHYVARQPEDNYQPRNKIVSYFLFQTDFSKIIPLAKEGFTDAGWFDLETAFKKLTYFESKDILLRAINKLVKPRKIKTAVVAIGGEGVRVGKKYNPKLLLKINGRPFFYFVLALLLAQFEKVYLLTGFYHQQLTSFVKKTFPRLINNRIYFIDGGIEGNAKALYQVKNLIKEPFLYMDGNVICSTEILKKLINFHHAAITLLVSPTSLINTHLHIKTKNGKIIDMIPVVSKHRCVKKLLCSLGIMVIDYRLFELIPDFSKFNDLDLVIDFVFRNRPEIDIKPVIYKGAWYCIHTKSDIESVNGKGRQLFCSLTKTPTASLSRR